LFSRLLKPFFGGKIMPLRCRQYHFPRLKTWKWLTIGVFTAAVGPGYAATVLVGLVNAQVSVNFSVAPPTGSTVNCSISLISNDALGLVETKSVSAPVSGSTAICRTGVRYRWTLASPTSKMTIAYTLSGPQQYSSGIITTIPMPANGSATAASVAVTQ
jgi:hypothetical protein